MLRFVGQVCVAFIVGGIGMSWALRGFPMSMEPPSFVAPLSPMKATFREKTAQDFERESWESTQTLQSDKDAERDRLRLDLLQAANGYSQSPCDQTMKANLVAALTAYTEAWQRKLNCARSGIMPMLCRGKREEAAAAFGTPLDRTVQAAVADATNQGGLVKADFKELIRFDVLQFAGPGVWSDDLPVCNWSTKTQPQRRLR